MEAPKILGYTDEWVLSLTNVKTNKGHSIGIINKEFDQILKKFPFINSRRALYFDLETNEVLSYEEGQKIMRHVNDE